MLSDFIIPLFLPQTAAGETDEPYNLASIQCTGFCDLLTIAIDEMEVSDGNGGSTQQKYCKVMRLQEKTNKPDSTATCPTYTVTSNGQRRLTTGAQWALMNANSQRYFNEEELTLTMPDGQDVVAQVVYDSCWNNDCYVGVVLVRTGSAVNFSIGGNYADK